MAEAPEIPEADDAFSKRVAITIALLAVLISVIGNKGDNAKTEAILKTTEAANKWAYFQAKSIKETAYELNREVLSLMPVGDADAVKRAALIDKYGKKITKYQEEKKVIGPGMRDKDVWLEQQNEQGEPLISAAQLDEEAKQLSAINDRTDQGSLLLQIAVILCSVAILVKARPFWFLGMGAGAVGAVVGLTAFLM